ncbi:T4S1 protein, partial [Polypterus senegalus]
MCVRRCSKCLGFSLIPLALGCIAANILLFFPNANTEPAESNGLSHFVWFFHGIIGAGIVMFLPATFFIVATKEDVCGCCERNSCHNRCPLLSSILVALIGIAGSGYCVIVSVLGLLQGPKCNSNNSLEYPFENDNGNYLTNYTYWNDKCKSPQNVVLWNVTLFSILLLFSGIQAIICFLQIINVITGAMCGPCSRGQAYNINKA